MFARLIKPCAIACLAAFSLHADDSSLSQFVEDSNAFSFALQHSAMQPSQNTVFSPYSIFTCLSMVYAGAKSGTAMEIQKTLGLHSNAIEAAHSSSQLRKSLVTAPKEGCSLQLASANALFADQDTFFLSSFSELVEKNYQAEMASIDFSQEDKALLTVNGWIANQTKEKIQQLLQKNDIDSSTRLILINAVYFQGKWQQPFDPKRTASLPFHAANSQDIAVSMMKQTSSFSYYETESAQILALPFQICQAQDPTINCLIILPKTSADSVDFDKQLSPVLLHEWIDHLAPQRVQVLLPRFCLKKRLDLGAALTQMGMATSFTDKADFSGINGMRDLYLSKVLHEAYFSLDEFGVEAAAATSAVMNVTAAPPSAPPILFTADHPFYFFLIDRKTKVLLFAGKLCQPDEASCP